MSGPNGMLHGPTGRKIGGGGKTKDVIPVKGDLKALWDWEARNRLFGTRFFHSELISGAGPVGYAIQGSNGRLSLPGSWGGADGNTDLETDVNEGDGVAALNLYSTAGGGTSTHIRAPSISGGQYQSWGLWPNTFAHFAFQVQFKWDPAHTVGTRKWEGVEHGIGDLYRDGWFVGLHGFHVHGGASGTAPAVGGPYISLTCGWSHWSSPGRAIHSTIPIVNGKWHRVQFGRDASLSYLKVDDEAFVVEKTSAQFVAQGYTAGILCEPYPQFQNVREAYIHGKGGSGSSSNPSLPLNSWWRSFYHAVGV